jgi:anti-sigma B factor antagonist
MDDLVLRFQMIGDVAVMTFVVTQPGDILPPDTGMYTLVDKLGYRKVVLNFTGVIYLMSSRLGQIISLKRKLEDVQGQLRMCCMEKGLRDVFEITKLDTLIPIDNNVDESVKAFS